MIIPKLRSDLEEYGGVSDVSVFYGNNKYGIQHIIKYHGKQTLSHVFKTLALGKIIRYVATNKTVVLKHKHYEGVLSLEYSGNKKTWLLTGYNVRKEENERFRRKRQQR